MYGKTNLGAGSLSPQHKRALAVAGSLVVLGLGGLGIWSAVTPDGYSGSSAGCVNVTIPSSTGGATVHYCGAAAKSFCKSAFESSDQLSLRARPQCKLAGLTSP
jgi:hypothetical protein